MAMNDALSIQGDQGGTQQVLHCSGRDDWLSRPFGYGK